MKKALVLALTLVLILSIGVAAQAASLTGKWSGNDGGTYYITQLNDRIYWYGENSTTSPGFANIGVGKIVGNYIFIEATDVPKGSASAQSDLIIYKSTDNYLYVITKDSPFGGSSWTRM
jgi:hypothetical protein